MLSPWLPWLGEKKIVQVGTGCWHSDNSAEGRGVFQLKYVFILSQKGSATVVNVTGKAMIWPIGTDRINFDSENHSFDSTSKAFLQCIVYNIPLL